MVDYPETQQKWKVENTYYDDISKHMKTQGYKNKQNLYIDPYFNTEYTIGMQVSDTWSNVKVVVLLR